MKIECSLDSFDKYCDLFDKMNYQAEDYAPTIEEIKDIIVPNLEEYILFLLWIDSTGEETVDNAKSRRLIRQIIKTNLVLVDGDKQ